MEFEFYKKNTKEFDNCRIQCIRDMLLFYGKNLPFDLLLLLSGTNIAYFGVSEFEGIRIPIFTPELYTDDEHILNGLNIPYKKERHDTDDRKWMNEMWSKGHPVICYYSQQTLVLKGIIPKVNFGLISALIPCSEVKKRMYTNIPRVRILKWKPFWDARTAELLPVSPDKNVLFLKGDKWNTENLTKELVKKSVYKNLKTVAENYVDCKKTYICGIECWNGREAVYKLKEMCQELIQRIEKTEDIQIIQSYVLLQLKILMQFMRLDYKHPVFEHIRYFKAIEYFSMWSNDFRISEWCKRNINNFLIWNQVFDLLVNESRSLQSKEEIKNFLEKLAEFFKKAAELENKAFLELLEIL